MNPSITNTKYILFFTVVFLVGIQSRSFSTQGPVTCASKKGKLTVAVPTCLTRQITVDICEGTCSSGSGPAPDGPSTVKICNCCSSWRTKTHRVQLYCRGDDGKIVKKFHDVEAALTCTCKPCKSS